MAAEYYITFEDKEWINNNKDLMLKVFSQYNTFVKCMNNEYWFKDFEDQKEPYYHVRLIIENKNTILMEISLHPENIEKTLHEVLLWIREQTVIIIRDEDGEISNW